MKKEMGTVHNRTKGWWLSSGLGHEPRCQALGSNPNVTKTRQGSGDPMCDIRNKPGGHQVK